MSTPAPIRHASRARSMGSFVPVREQPDEPPAAVPDWIGYRASVARAMRRLDAGEAVRRFCGCGTELDVDAPVHSPRCAGGEPDLDGPDPEPELEEESPDEELLDEPELDEASLTATRLTLQLLRTSAAELAALGATDPAIARHFANVCAHALDLLDAGEDA